MSLIASGGAVADMGLGPMLPSRDTEPSAHAGMSRAGVSTLDVRLRRLRKRRTASRLWNLGTLGAWALGLAALVTVVGAALATIR